MADESESQTISTFLARVRRNPADQDAWGDFVNRYGPTIYSWCRKRGLQDADAQDVAQTVLVKLARKMRDFAYDPARSFRAWLKTITQHACCDFLEGRKRPDLGSGSAEVGALLDTVEGRRDLAQLLEEAFDRELLEEATARVRRRVAPRTWDAFRLTALEGLSGAAAAARLRMKAATVYVARSEVQKMLAEEVRRLEGPGSA
jgi:RNA polymerase sigma-70 factor (ECF subfamily)